MSTATIAVPTTTASPLTPGITNPNNNIAQNDSFHDDILHDINSSQLQEYKDMLNQLGEYPDKILINTLTMIAEDYSKSYPKSSRDIYDAIKELLLSHSMRPRCKLPLVYVIDSILKNARGLFIEIMKEDFKSCSTTSTSINEDGSIDESDNIMNREESKDDALKSKSKINWMKDVFEYLGSDEESKAKLRKTWNTWNKWEQSEIFPHDIWSKIGQCFIEEDRKAQNAKMIADAKAKAAGIQRLADGTLQLPNKLRKHMQIVLDEIQMNQVNELDKVSLERLADINPDLLVQIKNAADELIQNEERDQQSNTGGSVHLTSSAGGVGGGTYNSGNGSNIANSKSSIFQELRSPDLIKQCQEWEKLNSNHLDNTNDVVKRLLFHVKEGTSTTITDDNFTHEKQNQIINLYGSASATANHLTSILDQLKKQDLNRGMMKFKAGSMKDLTGNLFFRGSKVVDKSKFTNEGLKEKNDSVISRLYEGGLPYVCPSDGRRFATQIELSKHYDVLFKRNQLEKSMEMTDERGWYQSDLVWSGMASKRSNEIEGDLDFSRTGDDVNHDALENDPMSSTVTADDTRPKCVICGVDFNVKFNEDEGEWVYENCKEIVVMNDDVAEQESELLLGHATCLKGLGSPKFLTRDQVLDTF